MRLGVRKLIVLVLVVLPENSIRAGNAHSGDDTRDAVMLPKSGGQPDSAL